MLIPQEFYTLNKAKPRHNMKIISSAFFNLASVWFSKLIKIWREDGRVGSGVNIEYVSDYQIA